ncbi:hypothetical protein D6D29_07291 [Aureobasidium pullulans]|nr:hypothetical protein D6D29_07291 [Aureobasidium pullulans]
MSVACLLSTFRKSVFIAQQLAGGWGHVYSRPPCAAQSSGTTMSQMTCPTPALSAPCPVCADVRRTAFRARNSMSYATDFVWYSLLPSAAVNRAQGCKRSRDNATTIGLFPSRHGKGPYGPGSHYREGTHHQPFGGGSQRLVRSVSTRSSAKSASSVARLYDGTILVAAVAATTSRIDNDDGNPPPTVRWWFPAIEEERQHEEQRLVRFERRQVGYRGNGQYQQFGRARHQQCAVLLGYEDVKNMTNAENFTKYDEAAFRAAISADPEFRYCMSTTCKSGQCHPARIDEPTFCCRKCGHNHCVSCEANWHEGLTCAQYQHSLQRAQEEEESQQEVAKSSAFVGSKLKTSQGTSSPCRALLGQYDRGTSFAMEEERQHESSGGIASSGNDTSTGFLPLSPSSNINQFTSFGGFGGGGAVDQINNGHSPAGIDMSVWSNISSSVEPTTSSSTKAHTASSSTKAHIVSSSTKAHIVSSSTKAHIVSSSTKAYTASSSTKAHIVSSTRELTTNRTVMLPSARPCDSFSYCESSRRRQFGRGHRQQYEGAHCLELSTTSSNLMTSQALLRDRRRKVLLGVGCGLVEAICGGTSPDCEMGGRFLARPSH